MPESFMQFSLPGCTGLRRVIVRNTFLDFESLDDSDDGLPVRFTRQSSEPPSQGGRRNQFHSPPALDVVSKETTDTKLSDISANSLKELGRLRFVKASDADIKRALAMLERDGNV
uniref:Uncharacterized protein n=1 Tax=Noctiluca scintillans TaxID=2966 RepID=A0A7S0ZTF0_NOCSC|mmetsp:Transcript_17247/g.46695  ORF Transcript_17247/g.46695 Transcript_17247/m.46695 type:complete len:115 (+) Transcript_17247:82-426(+)